MNAYRSTALRGLTNVFAGHAAGHYTLPERVTDAMDAIDRVTAEEAALAGDTDTMTGPRLVDAIQHAARTGTKFPTGAALAKAEQERQTRDAYRTALRDATEGLENSLESTVVGAAEETIAGHLRPALADVMAETAELARLLAPYGTDHAGLLEAPENARKARTRLDALAARYSAIRGAQATLTRVLGEPGDNGSYAIVANFDALTAGHPRGSVPWPTDSTVDALVWLATHDAQVWMPTPAERAAIVNAKMAQSTLRPKNAVLVG